LTVAPGVIVIIIVEVATGQSSTTLPVTRVTVALPAEISAAVGV